MPRRLTVEEIRAAYEATNTHPMAGAWTATDRDGGEYCCPLLAVVRAQLGFQGHPFSIHVMARRLNLSMDYASAFVRTWDGAGYLLVGGCGNETINVNRENGRVDGKEARRQLNPIPAALVFDTRR